MKDEAPVHLTLLQRWTSPSLAADGERLLRPTDSEVAGGVLNQSTDSSRESGAHLQTCKNASPLHFGH